MTISNQDPLLPTYLLNQAYVEQYMKKDRYLFAHYQYYIREMRIIAYNQLLESYSSLALSYMANAFGVSVQFIDKSVDPAS